MYCSFIEISFYDGTVLKISVLGKESPDRLEFTNRNVRLNCAGSKYRTDLCIDPDRNVPIILLENREYYIEVNFPLPRTISSGRIFQITENTSDIEYTIRFNSSNYVGILNLAEFGIYNPLIEVQSRKIDYEVEYSLLLKRISELGIDLTARAGSYFDALASLSDHDETDENYLSSKFAYIRSVILSGELEILYNAFFRKPLRRIIQEKQTSYSWEATDFDLNDYLHGLTAISFKDDIEKIYPLEIESAYFDDIVDNIENQFLKFLLDYLISYFENVLQKIGLNRDLNVLILELNECLNICTSLRTAPIFRSVSKMSYFPTKSNVLHQQYPYRDLYRLYWFMSQKIQISDTVIDNSLRIPQKDLPKLYEYWCFLNMTELLSVKFETDTDLQALIKYNPYRLCYIVDSEKCCIEFKILDNKILKLYYGKEYSADNYIYQGRSYSHTLTPDISLELFVSGSLIAIIHFDAKYKLENNTEFKTEDLDKMHTYKDGILGTVGSYILYPGKKTERFIQEEKDIIPENLHFPSVGAFIYNIEGLNENDEKLHILSLIDNFIEINNYLDGDGAFSEKNVKINYLKRLLE